ncbi:adenylate kinase family protein [Cylindrospermum sp. FACHB-282]|uniref:adenylate kinase family protein n=1 Tax=Cylindrospermum sp. FACHB-282 TaxID=2692794 RepID=UPI001689A42B|nr:nucleoside monophosphate kinase [Cylindrospermum sp. FACHB-282]MBD2385818.1 nucleoside monophosphate kinase [Cylindrospermum sp. FACHB-282]
MKLVILGGSGAGKSTQAQRLCRYFDISLISTGETLREAMSKENALDGYSELSDLGRYTQPYVETGELVPDEMMIELIRVHLTKFDVNSSWVLEGYPRTAFQAEELDFLLDDLGQKLDWAIYLQVPAAVMVSRSLGRLPPALRSAQSLPDDQPEIVQRRVELFYDRTVPILEYYDRRRRLLTINGDQSPELVQQNILTLLSIP